MPVVWNCELTLLWALVWHCFFIDEIHLLGQSPKKKKKKKRWNVPWEFSHCNEKPQTISNHFSHEQAFSPYLWLYLSVPSLPPSPSVNGEGRWVSHCSAHGREGSRRKSLMRIKCLNIVPYDPITINRTIKWLKITHQNQLCFLHSQSGISYHSNWSEISAEPPTQVSLSTTQSLLLHTK